MVGRRGRLPKRKVEELHEDLDEKSKPAKEARIEAFALDTTEPAHISLLTLTADTWKHQASSHEWAEHIPSAVSGLEDRRDGTRSRGTYWKGRSHPAFSRVALSCNRLPNGDAFDCASQILHFQSVTAPKVLVVPETDAPESIKVEIDTDQQEEFLNRPLVCCVTGCGARSDADANYKFYKVPLSEERYIWAETLNIILSDEESSKQYVCSQHFITPSKFSEASKGRVRKKKTFDMMLAEEAERISKGLSAGRPKRTPKLNKNYDWAEVSPLIKPEPNELEQEGSNLSASSSAVFQRQEKENIIPVEEAEADESVDEEEEREDLQNISLPSLPRPPPPKSKGRPHMIRDSCTQSESPCIPLRSRVALREVKVQCNINTEPTNLCLSCSYINWLRLEELLIDCSRRVEGELCAPLVRECLRKAIASIPHPTHATNVLKLLIGDSPDPLENTSDIVLMPCPEDEVEVENVVEDVVLPDVDEPVGGFKEIRPRPWKKNKWRKVSPKVERTKKTEEMEEEEDPHDVGIQEATELDDDEFHPSFFDGEETEEDDAGLDDEEWTINRQERDKHGIRKRQKKAQQQQQSVKVKREQMVMAGEGPGVGEGTTASTEGTTSPKTSEPPLGRRRRQEGDSRWIRKAHQCAECGSVFSTQKKYILHFNHVHLGIAPWQGEHVCNDCGQVFTQKISLNVHRMFKHGAPRRYHCSKCTYEAPTKEYLKRHLKVHSDERLFVCPHCNKGLKTAESFRNHLVIHTNKGRFMCPVCQKAYNHKGAYQDHIRTHCEHRDYSCDYCGAAFKAYRHVARHIRAVHLNDKRFICDVCGSQHLTSFNLRTHLKKHGDLSSLSYAYQCAWCEATFRGPEGRAVHTEVYHTIPSTSGEGPINKDEEKRKLSPHPTRRPVQFYYTKLPRKGQTDKPITTNEHEIFGTIYLDNTDDLHALEGREDEAVVYEVYSGGEEEELEENENKVKEEEEEAGEPSGSSKERVIYVYPCSGCQIMFTSKSMLEQHHNTCQQQSSPATKKTIINV